MFRWFRSGPQRPDTAVAMIDPRPGNNVLFLGADRPSLAGECGAFTGLNGRTVVVASGAEAAKRIEQAAGQAGALVEFIDAPLDALPIDADVFDLAVVPDLAAWPSWSSGARMAEAIARAAPGRAGGGAGRAEARRHLRRAAPSATHVATETVLALLANVGFIAARRLAEVDGVAYYEARKKRTPS